jgi:hypothetical protein
VGSVAVINVAANQAALGVPHLDTTGFPPIKTPDPRRKFLNTNWI